MPSFADWLQLIAPPWLLDPGGRAMLSTVGSQMDRTRDRARQATLARFPLSGPSDALPKIGVDRQLPRAPYDTDASYAETLIHAWEIWGGDPVLGGGAGTPAGVIHAVQRAGFPVTFATDPGGSIGATTVVSWNGRWAQISSDGMTPVFGQLDLCPDRPGGQQIGWYDGQEALTTSPLASIFWLLLFAPAGEIDGLTNDPSSTQKQLLNATVQQWNRAAGTFGGTFVIANPTWQARVPGPQAIRSETHFLERLTGPQQYVLGWPPVSIDPSNVIGGAANRGDQNSVLFIDPA